ncbi:UNVERIFIED_CONTAM: RagB/SusD family nutrient uptake outer membrane protein, partial [Prevotella sp. 15_C9]
LGETNPYTGEAIGVDPAYNAEFVGTDHNPNVYTLKYWREQHGAMKKDHNYNPCSLTMKRYAGVLLDYAECCFRTNDEATGW